MKTDALRAFRRKLASGEPVFGLWITLESASITEMAVASGLDWVVVDAEHGHLDWSDILQHIRAAVRSETVVIVRIAELQEGLVKRALDIGADGVLIPHINSAEEWKRALHYALYPPDGIRGIGAERATGWGHGMIQHTREANENVLIIPLIESTRGGENIEAMLEVPGSEIFFFGPADYCASAGHTGQWEVKAVTEHLFKAKDLVVKANKYCGIVASDPQDIENRRGQGFRMIAYGFDSGMILKGIKNISAALHLDRRISTDFRPPIFQTNPPVANTPPADLSPGRHEAIQYIGDGIRTELEPGIHLEVQVSEHNNARNLFTAIVSFDAGYTELSAHQHPHAESITLLSGTASVLVEDRLYILYPLDNITIPKDCPHTVKNLSPDLKASFHIAMPVAKPVRVASETFNGIIVTMPDDHWGTSGRERVTRHRSAARYPSGPYTEFVDFFNEGLMPGLEMSGGYALFHQGGRLPAHFHDFDESICIVEGKATCFVEGRRYQMSDLATALQPRGRIHYFINDSPQPMAMIWVYAGPMPIRTEVKDEYASIGIG